jgi:hypothetical protein
MTSRHRVANRRAVETFAVEVEGQRYKISLGREITVKLGPLENPRVAESCVGPVVEVFVNAQKVNSQADVLASDGAILMSLLIQYGHPIEEIAQSMKHHPDLSPASPLGVAAALINHSNDILSALDPAMGAETAAAPELTDPPAAAADYFTQPGD